MSTKSLKDISKEDLLDMRICDLDLCLESSKYFSYIKILNKELRNKKINFTPKVWISDDWFSPDGISGFAIPFYLLDDRLIELEREMIGVVEGEDKNWFMKLIRHETAHALDNAFFLRDCLIREKLFGSIETEYPCSYIPKRNTKNFVIHLEDGYAQAHPEEDFAETFATWLDPNSSWKETYENWPAIRKLNYVNRMMKDLAGKKQNVFCHQEVDCYTENTKTLRQFYREKRKRLGIRDLKRESISHIKSYVTKRQTDTVDLAISLRKNRSIIKKNIATKTKYFQYQVENALDDLEKMSKLKGLRIRKSHVSNKNLTRLAHGHALKFFKEGRHKVFM